MTQRTLPRHRRQENNAGAVGNEKLTAMTGVVLLAGFFIEGVTIVELHRLLVLHFVVGALLIGPVLLKIGSTMYRFIRYYAGSQPYLRKGPPAPLLRVLGPLVILTSSAVISTGVVLAVVGPGSGPWLFLHKASFVLWFGVMTVHVVWYAPQLPRLLLGRLSASAGPDSAGPDLAVRDSADRDIAGRASVGAAASGTAARWFALVTSLAVGVAIAAATMDISGKWGMHL